MGTIHLVRHGQASFGAADYDQLSELGTRQCHALGQWFAARGTRFDGVLRGTLRRHAQSLAAIADGHGGVPVALEWPGLNEYDSEALIRAIHPGPLAKPHASDAPEVYRAHFRLLRHGLGAWMAGSTQPVGMPSWPAFVAGVTSALDHVRQKHEGDVLIVSSGGPIATAIAQVLGAPDSTMVELNMRTRNSSLTEFAYTPKRCMLQAYNQVPHLDHPERRGWLTYS
jgi:broad specificity phosphatase PhoE